MSCYVLLLACVVDEAGALHQADDVGEGGQLESRRPCDALVADVLLNTW